MEVLHRLLERQLKRFKVDIVSNSSDLYLFAKSISKSYAHYEDSRLLVERAMEISNLELEEANNKLIKDSSNQKLLIERLKETIKDVSVDGKEVNNNDILQVLRVLESEIKNRKKLEEDLEKARKHAEESLKSKELFLANMSHEIRTPLNAILGMSWLMSKSGLSTNQREYQDVIKSSAKNLLVIINDILDISKLTSGKLTLEKITFDLNELLDHLIKSMAFKANEKDIDLLLEIDSDIQNRLKGDPTRLNQILSNLVGNSIKFTKKGSVKVVVKLKESKQKSDIIEFSIIDTGVGISDENIQNIFNSFSQEDPSVSRKFGGTGLGLTISKEIVEAFGSKIVVSSEKNKGSQFSFTLELGYATPILKAQKNRVKISKDLSETSILVVEDDEFNLLFLVAVLEGWNANVCVAKNGLEALGKLKGDNFDLILMDMHMPIMDGLTAANEIRKSMSINTPIIALTADVIKSKEKCFEAGMNDFVSKPFNPDELYPMIKKYVSNSKI